MPRARKPLAPVAPVGGVYGSATTALASQRAVPVAPAPASSPRQAPPPRRPPAQRVLGPIDRPTERPDEPLTAGLPIGPGPGPEVLGAIPDDDALDAQALAPYLPTLELMASSPNASTAMRNFVRRLRSAAPLQGA